MTASWQDSLGESFPQHWIAAGWPLIFLATIGASMLFTFPIVGYRWTGELVAGVLIVVGIAVFLYNGNNRIRVDTSELYLIILPLILFTAWSALSALWASSVRGALHHTLLWGSYLMFFVLIRQTLNSRKAGENAVKVTGAIIFAISVACLIDYMGYPGEITQRFTARYYVYAEAFVAFLPLFAAVVFKSNRKFSILALTVIASIWAMTLATSSRAMFFGGIFGIFSFLIVLFFSSQRELIAGKKLVAVAGVMMLIPLLFIAPSAKGTNVIERLSGEEAISVTSAQSRLLFWGMAIEGFRRSPVIGIGAGGYFAEYRKLRESFSEANPESPAVAINENLIPGRAHNEYLQVLSELGLAGVVILGWLIVGIIYLFFRAKSPSIFMIGAFAGVLVFLATSAASSYSFRFPIGGMAFFFLAAFALPIEIKEKSFSAKWLVVGAVLPLMMIVFSVVRGASVYYLASSVAAQDRIVAESKMQTAFSLDEREPMFHYFYGQMLNQSGRSDEATTHFRFAIDNGFATSSAYFTLANTYEMLGQSDNADNTFGESLRLYPRSVFIRTAYATFLKRSERNTEAKVQFEIADGIDRRQALSWQLAHDEGLERLAQTLYHDPNYVQAEQLLPVGAAEVLANSQMMPSNRGTP